MRRILEAAVGLSLAGLVGCAGDVGTIDRTQPNALRKDDFNGIWYTRATIVEANPEAGHVEGITGNTDKIRWEITQDLLIAYRSYEFVPYAEGLTDEGRDFFGSPVAAFPIVSHFDIQRDYNSATGVQSNVIVENTTDRPWYDREYIRVDWTTNQVGSSKFWFGWANYPSGYLTGTPTKYYIQDNEETNPDRPIFTRDYMDVTNVYNVEPDEYYCVFMLINNGVYRCGSGNVKVRLSFRKIDPKDDYESLHYPDMVELKDDAGNALVTNFDGRRCDSFRDPSECYVQTYPYDAQFGNFRLLRVAFDHERFLTRTGRIYVAGRHNIWKNTFNDADGARIPFAQREPKPIIYYGNTNFPEDMIEGAHRIAAMWNKPFKQTVAYLQGKVDGAGKPRLDQVPDMFVFKQNDCNVTNIREYAQRNGLTDVVERLVGSVDRIARGNVDKVCAAVQAEELKRGKTLDPNAGGELAFTWQRKGDLRYNFNNYVDPLQTGGPWGVAQFGQDPETGEFFSNTANYFGTAGDSISQSAVDMIQWLNGEIESDELLRGDLSRDTVVQRRGRVNPSIREDVEEAFAEHERAMLESSGDKLFGEQPDGAEGKRFARMFKGSQVEREYLLSDEILRGFAGPTKYQPFGASSPGQAALPGLLDVVPGEVSDAAREAASPANWGMTSEENEYNKFVTDFGSRGWEMADFFDPRYSGLAEKMRGKPREEIWQFLRVELYAAVQAHEVGHTVGLRHNFEASMDALNYKPEFWYQENPDGTVTQYWNNKPKLGNPNRGEELKYASIMDYGFDIPNEGLHGIGSYDEAAIRFMYGQLVDVWDTSKISIPDPRKFGSFARRCGYVDQSWGFSTLMFWLLPESIPSLLSVPAVDGGTCIPVNANTGEEDWDNDESCDSPADAMARAMVVGMEAAAARFGSVSECTLLLEHVNPVFEKAQRFLPEDPAGQLQGAKNIYDARRTIPVEDFIRQRIEIVKDEPEYDNAATADVDESRDGIDDDSDGRVDDKGFRWSQVYNAVDYKYCSDLYAGFSNPNCQRWDAGWDFNEMIENHINRYDRDYVFDHFRRDRSEWGNPRSFMSRLESRTLYHMTNVFRYYLYTRGSALAAPRLQDWRDATYKGLNFLERIIQTPEPGRYCLNAGGTRYDFDPFETQQDCRDEFRVGLGSEYGKFLNTAWTNEYFYKPNRIGAFYDKLAAVKQLTTSSGFFARDVADLFDRRAFSLGYLRVYDDPILQRFAALIRGDHTGYESAVITVDGEKRVRYMPFLDEVFREGSCTTNAQCPTAGTSCDALPGTTGQCVGGSVRRSLDQAPKIPPAWSWSLQYFALAYAMSNFSSINDYAPEFYRFTKIAVKGTPEDVDYPPQFTIVEFTDPETLLTYRAPDIDSVPPASLGNFGQEFPAYYGDRLSKANGKYHRWGVGGAILRAANDLVAAKYNPAKAQCPNPTQNTAGCKAFAAARRELNELVGYIDVLRDFNKRAEY